MAESDNGHYDNPPKYYRNCDKHRGYGDCALCGKHNQLVSDHCHSTGLCRELLCGPCNRGLGQFYDDPELMRRAAAYVEKHASIHARYPHVKVSKTLSTKHIVDAYRAAHPRGFKAPTRDVVEIDP